MSIFFIQLSSQSYSKVVIFVSIDNSRGGSRGGGHWRGRGRGSRNRGRGRGGSRGSYNGPSPRSYLEEDNDGDFEMDNEAPEKPDRL